MSNRLRTAGVQRRTFACLLAMFAGTVAVCFAQDSRGAPRDGNRPILQGGLVPKIRLLALKQVRAELNLTEEQKSRAAKINEKLESDVRELFERPGDDAVERRKEITRLSREAGVQAEELLDEAQRRRLREIWIQVNGGGTLHESEVSSAVGLTESQQRKLAEIRTSMLQELRDANRGVAEATRERRMEFRRSRDRRLLRVLTDEQRQRFEQLGGEPIEIELRQLLPRRNQPMP